MSKPADLNLNDWLLRGNGDKWLALASSAELSSLQLTTKLRESLTQEQTHGVLELAELRQRALQKFTAAEKMFFTRTSFEQATDQWIAQYKAARFADRGHVADLCCGIGGDALGLLQVANKLTLCDRSPELVKYAARNLAEAYPEDVTPTVVRVGDVTELALGSYGAWHIDPDRRAGGKRTTHAEFQEPSDVAIDTMLTYNPHAAIKLAPACEVPPRWAEAGELEWISRDGECRQLVVWHGELTESHGQRRATMVKAADHETTVVRTLVGSGDSPMPADETIEHYVYEPDAAVLASGLASELAQEHQWWSFASTSGYLTGTTLVDEPATSRFEVQEVLPLNTKKLARYLRVRNVGQLEIKHRAVDLNPEQLRRELKLEGDNRATLLLTRVGEKRIAIVANRAGDL
ncbi:class I SAM-dependent methyltransferase [Aeoliella mucimassa]|uniref:THUMP-like domain-containing protein n=1 Tax=Aeoliella mucimassa TaxID=2527972 RepID=A0A518ANW6_9BACT|nr:class I SAM-dependent methyltransferase [Aeoliella mucimassa]QDU56415.1 hypothetical protein Pan181_26240 [Aeoliella mucimassa]